MSKRFTLRLALVALAAFIGGEVWLAWWLSHPNVLQKTGWAVELHTAVGKPLTTSMWFASRGSAVTIDSVRPDVVENSAAAAITVKICVRNAQHIRTLPNGSREHDLYCPRWVPVAHQHTAISMAAGASDLAVVVTPRQPGVVHINGLRVTYHESVRRQTQTRGMDLTIKAP